MSTMTRSTRLVAYPAALLTMLLGLLVATPAHATVTPVVVGGVTYSYDDANPTAGAIVTNYTPGVDQTAVTIESDVTVPGVGSVPVKTINDDVFKSKALASVTFTGNNLTTIGDDAFRSNNLTTITIPNTVTTIGTNAFFFNLLTTVTIPGSVTTIGPAAFAYNYLTTVTIGNSVTTIGHSAFASNDLTTVTIPGSVTTIRDYAFASNMLTTVAIGGSVTTIDDSAFHNNELTTVTIPGSVTTIGDSAFDNNVGLRSVRFTGPAPTVTAAGNSSESFDTASGVLVLHHPATQTGYTSPTWNDYTTMAGLAPTIGGTAREGRTLTARTGITTIPTGAEPTTFTYQWFANGAPLTGATQPTLKLAKAHAGRRISVRITSTSPGPDTETRTTALSPIVSSPHKRIVLSTTTVKKGTPFTVTATGLKANQRYAIWLGGKKAHTGKADTNGNITRTVKFKNSIKPGTRRVRVSGYKGKKRTYTVFIHTRYTR